MTKAGLIEGASRAVAHKLSGLVVAFSLLALVPTAFAQQTQRLQIKSFSVGPDQTLTYPNSSSGANQLTGLADEHTTFFPPAASGAPYLVFGAAATSATAAGIWGAVVLQTTDLKTFTFAPGYSTPELAAPLPFSKCDPFDNTGFDQNYAAPGSVVQDPTMPPGNLIMLYEAENHCPGGLHQQPFYATVGFARSSDNGKTWPAPASGVLGGPSRHPVVQSPEPQPTTPHGYLGNAIPSGFVDKSASGDYYLYAAYTYFSSSGQAVRVARAKLGSDPLTFLKWYNGSFGQPGIGGLDSAVTPSTGCGGTQQEGPEISYNDDLGLYLMIFKCYSGPASARVGAWYYSTATSLDLEDWTAPQLIQNSQYPLTSPCPGQTTGQDFDGFYPATMSPGAPSGHTKLTGYFFFSHVTCDLTARQFLSRTFTITPLPVTPVAHAADGNNFKTTFILTSADTAPAPYTLQFNDAGGNTPVPPVPLELGSLAGTIPPGGSATIRTAGTGSFVGWAELNAPATVGGSVIYSQKTQLPTIQEGTTTLTASGSQHFFLPFDNTQGAVTAMALTNPGIAAASVTVTLRYTDGTMETPAYPPLAGGNHQSFALPAQFTNSSNRSGVAEFVSSAPLYSVVFRFNPTGAFTALDVVQPGAASPSITRTLSHAGDGSGFKTTVLLTNTAAQPEPYVLKFDDPQGNAPSPPVALELGSLTGMIPAGGSATIRTAGTGSFIGWAELTAPAAVGGSVIYSQPHLTTIQEGTASIVSAGTQHFFLPFDNTNGAVTAMGLTNSGASAANLTVTVRYSDGTMETPSLPPLASRNHQSFTIPGQFPNASNRSGVAD